MFLTPYINKDFIFLVRSRLSLSQQKCGGRRMQHPIKVQGLHDVFDLFHVTTSVCVSISANIVCENGTPIMKDV